MNLPSVSSLIDFSWKKTKELLFPFNLKRWIKILFIVWLSGQAAGLGGNYNIPTGRRPLPPAPEQRVDQAQAPAQAGQATIPQEMGIEEDLTGDVQLGKDQLEPTEPESEGPPLSPVVIALIVAFVIPIALLFGWLSARFNFIFLDFIVNGDVRIRESFRAHKTIGNSYFLFSLLFGLSVAAIFAVVGLTVALMVSFAKPTLFLLIPLAIVLLLFLTVIGVSIIDFVVPLMYQDKIKAMDALKKFLSAKPSWGQIGLYILLKIGLGIASGIVSLVIAIICFVAFLIAGLVIAIPVGMIAAALPFLKPVFVILGAIFLIAAILAFMVALGLLTLPIPIFFRALALSYLYRLLPAYNLLNFNPPSTSNL